MRSPPFILLFAAIVRGLPTQSEPSNLEGQLWNSMGEFGHSLLKRTVEKSQGANVLTSPLSIHSALSMVLLGAEGKTRDEMIQTMHLNGIEPESLRRAFSELSSRKHENTTEPGQFFPDVQFIMRIANRVYTQANYPLAPEYVSDVKSTFHADAVNVDFTANGAAAQNEINNFVNEKTNRLIPKILQAPLPKDTVMVLVNALYFKGDWKERMFEENTELTFNKGCKDLEKQQSKWLTVTRGFPYLESPTLGAKLVRIPYKSKEFSASMLIILPNDEHSCKTNQWLQKLQWSNIRDELKKMQYAKVILKMPRFEMSYRANLEDILPTMGMSQVFKKGEADLSKMVTDKNERLNIDKVIHETKMIVTEFGTEAAAATVASVVRLTSLEVPQEPIPMTVDRSFYVAILYDKYDSTEVLPLFTGVVHSV